MRVTKPSASAAPPPPVAREDEVEVDAKPADDAAGAAAGARATRVSPCSHAPVTLHSGTKRKLVLFAQCRSWCGGTALRAL